MGKKNDKIKEAAAIAVVEKNPAKAKAAAKKRAVKKSPAGSKKPAYTNDDIALRAYFIAEKRHKTGIPGDAHQDWVEAEKQLVAESRKAAAKTVASKPVAKSVKKA